jgi:hypothetical protein
MCCRSADRDSNNEQLVAIKEKNPEMNKQAA